LKLKQGNIFVVQPHSRNEAIVAIQFAPLESDTFSQQLVTQSTP
jgi:hypothetical protein